MIHHHIIRSSRSGFLLQEANRPKARHTPLNPAVLLLPPLKMDGYGSWDTMDLHQIEVCPTSLLLCSRLPCCRLRPASTACAKENCEVSHYGVGALTYRHHHPCCDSLCSMPLLAHWFLPLHSVLYSKFVVSERVCNVRPSG
jgi:hypothetical protein